MKIHVLEGYFGDAEWIEGLYTNKRKAIIASAELWKHRRSEVLAADDYRQGLCKFLVYTLETK